MADAQLFCAERTRSTKMNKICETNPILDMPKINITDYMTSNYMNNSRVLEMQKRTQSNPTCGEPVESILTCYKGCKAKSKPNLRGALSLTERDILGIMFGKQIVQL
jgi:hypothetical protein